MNSCTPSHVLKLSNAFMESRILLTGAELNVFTLLCDSPMSLDDVATSLKTSPRGTAILLDALTAMELLKKVDGRYICPKETSKILSADSPETVLPMIRHAADLWCHWAQLTKIVREGRVQRPPEVFQEQAELEAFVGAMHVVGKHLAGTIAERCQAEASRRLLDVGGATGTYTEAFLRHYPAMRATVFDRPPVIEFARKRLAQMDIMARITLAAGNFYVDELPVGHDLALVSAIIHQNSPEQNVELYRKVFRALVPGGRIIVRDYVMNADRNQPCSGAFFAVNMLVATASGNCYTFDEIRTTLAEAGFIDIRLMQSGDAMDGLIEGYRR